MKTVEVQLYVAMLGGMGVIEVFGESFDHVQRRLDDNNIEYDEIINLSEQIEDVNKNGRSS